MCPGTYDARRRTPNGSGPAALPSLHPPASTSQLSSGPLSAFLSSRHLSRGSIRILQAELLPPPRLLQRGIIVELPPLELRASRALRKLLLRANRHSTEGRLARLVCLAPLIFLYLLDLFFGERRDLLCGLPRFAGRYLGLIGSRWSVLRDLRA